MGQRSGYTHLDTTIKERLFTHRKALFAHWRECDEAGKMLSASALKRLCYGKTRSARTSVLDYVEALIADWAPPGSRCSKFKIAVHPDVMDTLNALSPALRVNIYTVFATIIDGGLTALCQTNIKFHGRPNTSFTLKIPTHPVDISIIDGHLIHGFFLDDFNQTFYLQSIEEIPLRKGRFSHALFVDPPEGLDVYNTAAYLPVTVADTQKAVAHPIAALTNRRLSTPWCPALDVLRRFYQNIYEVEKAARCRVEHGSLPIMEPQICRYIDRLDVFDRESSLDFDLLLEPPADTIRFVSFIDKTDAFSMAQQDFVRLMVRNLKRQYPDNSFEIAEIVVKDEDGPTPHYELFLQEHQRNLLLHGHMVDKTSKKPRPFSLLIGMPCIGGYQQAQRMMNFDLFKGCVHSRQLPSDYDARRSRGEPSLGERNNEIFRSNIKYLTHALTTLTGFCAEMATAFFFDLQGRAAADVADAIVMLWPHAVVVSVAVESKSRVHKLVRRASSHMALSGYPHIMTLLTGETIITQSDVEISGCTGDDVTVFGLSVEELDELDDCMAVTKLCALMEKTYKANQALSALLPTNHPELITNEYLLPGLFNDPQRQMGFFEEDRPKN